MEVTIRITFKNGKEISRVISTNSPTNGLLNGIRFVQSLGAPSKAKKIELTIHEGEI